jgi:hypothetical protein
MSFAFSHSEFNFIRLCLYGCGVDNGGGDGDDDDSLGKVNVWKNLDIRDSLIGSSNTVMNFRIMFQCKNTYFFPQKVVKYW